jgi:hypothetical protein
MEITLMDWRVYASCIAAAGLGYIIGWAWDELKARHEKGDTFF